MIYFISFLLMNNHSPNNPAEQNDGFRSHSDRTSIGLFKLTWPIFVENLLRVSLSSVDVFMLSFYSEKAVAAVGLVGQLVFFIQLLYLMVAVGSSILIAQHLGARQPRKAGQIALGSFTLASILSLILSVAMCLNADMVLRFYKLDPQVHCFAWQFLFIYSIGSIFTAFGMVQGAILRTHGHTREPMVCNVIANVINVAGNYLFIFGPFGIPVLGVVGVALSTVFSQAFVCVALMFRLRSHHDIELPFREIRHVPRAVYRKILAVGIPTAGENLSYTIGQIIILRMVSSMGTDALAAFVYSLTILRFVHTTSISIGNGTQIKVGYYVGAGSPEEAYHRVYRYFLTGFFLSLLLVIAVNLFQSPLLAMLTKNPAVLHLAAGVFLVSLVLEPGRNFNIIIIPALKGAGDVRFPVYMGMIFMWGVGVLFAYVFGIAFGWGLIGVWIALACDEWVRGLIMLFRWKNGRWRNKALVQPAV
jgi:putative MATE family efflux protein